MKELLLPLCFTLLFTSCNEEKRVVLVDDGKIYTTLNMGEFLDWDSKEIREIANEFYWQSKAYKYRTGLKGVVIEEDYHLNQPNTVVYVVKIEGFDDFYIPIESTGVKEIK